MGTEKVAFVGEQPEVTWSHDRKWR